VLYKSRIKTITKIGAKENAGDEKTIAVVVGRGDAALPGGMRAGG
jgi:hypothetical protein